MNINVHIDIILSKNEKCDVKKCIIHFIFYSNLEEVLLYTSIWFERTYIRACYFRFTNVKHSKNCIYSGREMSLLIFRHRNFKFEKHKTNVFWNNKNFFHIFSDFKTIKNETPTHYLLNYIVYQFGVNYHYGPSGSFSRLTVFTGFYYVVHIIIL